MEYLNAITKKNITKGTAIAVDFDGTLYISEYPEIISPTPEIISYIRECKSKGAARLLWTCREGSELQQAVDWCKENNIPIDYVNKNVPERATLWQNDCRKVGTDYYIDDKCINPLDIVKGDI